MRNTLSFFAIGFLFLAVGCGLFSPAPTPAQVTQTPPPGTGGIATATARPATLTAVSPSSTPPSTPTAVPTATATPVQTGITPEDYPIYAAVIRSEFGDSPKQFVIVNQTEMGISVGEGEADKVIKRIQNQFGSALQADTVADFRVANQTARTLEQFFPLDKPVILITPDELQAIMGQQYAWDAFYQKYPDSQGSMFLSAVGFNQPHTQALVYMGNMAYHLAGAGYYLLLEKQNDAWQVVDKFMAWIS